MRVALYFTPPRDAPVTRLAAEWLGRDAFATGGASVADALVAEPARYGFHATMKPPMRLRDGHTPEEIDRGLAAFCAARAATEIPRLALRRIGRFFALVPDEALPDLDALAGETVRQFERFRAPLSDAERARRAPDRLTERQRALLDAWGYPYVFEEFRFHMTLTGPVDEPDAAAVDARLRRHFAPVLGCPLPVDGLALFVEDEPGAPFRVRALHPLSTESRTRQT
ncbi:DUF1045 domain-containing protein [Aureimonas flava]|uniref:DUF1045 domain-containing protein n=1 Tax=Aureimonas flava TaxID=2320271 RepID=A0A3A1WT95_9HYPH|nr:DUF1045 domain-containing protein [Aureimonas flava]RIY03831.1 DUF1045 domain-containing protein [Aureimonas flava]